MKMANNLKELQEKYEDLQGLAKYYQNQAEYYHEKAIQWHKQAERDDAEQSRLIGLMNKIYVLTDYGCEDTVDSLTKKLDQIRKLTKKA